MSSEQADETCIANSRREIFLSHRGRGGGILPEQPSRPHPFPRVISQLS